MYNDTSPKYRRVKVENPISPLKALGLGAGAGLLFMAGKNLRNAERLKGMFLPVTNPGLVSRGIKHQDEVEKLTKYRDEVVENLQRLSKLKTPFSPEEVSYMKRNPFDAPHRIFKKLPELKKQTKEIKELMSSVKKLDKQNQRVKELLEVKDIGSLETQFKGVEDTISGTAGGALAGLAVGAFGPKRYQYEKTSSGLEKRAFEEEVIHRSPIISALNLPIRLIIKLLALDPSFAVSSGTKISEETKQKIREYIEQNPELKDIKIEYGGFNLRKGYERWKEKKGVVFTSPKTKIVGAGLALTNRYGSLLGGTVYDAPTNTLLLNSNNPAIAVYNLGKAKFYHRIPNQTVRDAVQLAKFAPAVNTPFILNGIGEIREFLPGNAPGVRGALAIGLSEAGLYTASPLTFPGLLAGHLYGYSIRNKPSLRDEAKQRKEK